jgi:hypothetical protein
MGLSSVFVTIPPPSGLALRANDCLPAGVGVDVHVLDRDLLQAFAAMAIEHVEQNCEGARVFLPGQDRLTYGESPECLLAHSDRGGTL